MTSVRILHVVSGSACSNAVKQFALLSRWFDRNGFESHLCHIGKRSLRGASMGLRADAGSKRIASTLDPILPLKLRRTLRQVRPGIVHTWDATMGAYVEIASMASDLRCLIHCDLDTAPFWTKTNGAFTRLFGKCRRVVVSSPAARDAYDKLGVTDCAVEVVPLAAPRDLHRITDRQDILTELGVPEHSRLIGAADMGTTVHGLKDLIWTTELLRVVGEDVHLIVFCESSNRHRLRRYGQRVGISQRIHLIPQPFETSRFIPHFDVFWSSTQDGSQSSLILEAMSAAVPVVVIDTTTNRHLIGSESNGILLSGRSRAALARQTLRLLNDRELSTALGGRGQTLVGREHNAETAANRYIDIYHKIAAKHGILL